MRKTYIKVEANDLFALQRIFVQLLALAYLVEEELTDETPEVVRVALDDVRGVWQEHTDVPWEREHRV